MKSIIRVILLSSSMICFADSVDQLTATAALWNAVRIGNVEAARTALQKGANADSKDAMGNTPMHYAIAANHREIIAALINAGASVHGMKNNDGREPAHVAALYNDVETLRLLAVLGTDLGAQDKHKIAPADLAALHCHVQALNFLAEQGDSGRVTQDFITRFAQCGSKEAEDNLRKACVGKLNRPF